MKLKYSVGDEIRWDIYHTNLAMRTRRPSLSHFGKVTKVNENSIDVLWNDGKTGIVTWIDSQHVTVLSHVWNRPVVKPKPVHAPEIVALADQIRHTKPVLRNLAWNEFGKGEFAKPHKVRLFKMADFSFMADLRKKGKWVISEERTGRAVTRGYCRKPLTLEAALEEAKYWTTTIPFKVSKSILVEEVLNPVQE